MSRGQGRAHHFKLLSDPALSGYCLDLENLQHMVLAVELALPHLRFHFVVGIAVLVMVALVFTED